MIMTTGCDRQGRILAHRVDALLDTGAYASLGPAVLENFLDHATAPLYRIEAYSVSGRLVYTNNGVSGAFRGLAEIRQRLPWNHNSTPWPKSWLCARWRFAESICARLMNPAAGARWCAGVHRRPMFWPRLAPHPSGRPRFPDARRRWLTGTGMAMGAQGNGLGDGLPDRGGGRVSLSAEGRIRLEFGFSDYGQNLAEAITCLVCETLGCVAGDIDVVLGNSRGRIPVPPVLHAALF